MNLNDTLKTVIEVAQSAGAYLKEEQSKLKNELVETKSTRNYVTYIDKAAEKIIVEGLLKEYPDTGFLTEEGTIESKIKEWTWIIDPLDGTTNYINNDTPYSVSIALQHNEVTVLGVVYDPIAEELFHAIEGEKAVLNNQHISVSKQDTLTDSYIGFGIPYVVNSRAMEVLQNTTNYYSKCSFRIKGSAAIELCYVADGRYDAYYHSGLSPWDVAAGSFILQQAGGMITDFNNSDNYIYGREIVATNGHIHNELVEKIINGK